MKFIKLSFVLLLFPLLSSSVDHKFYVSITKIEYLEESNALQVISSIFIDDIEDALQERYRPDVSLATTKETEADRELLKAYILQKLKIYVNNEEANMTYIGSEYEVDMVKVYIEITDVPKLKSIKIENKVLLDMFEEQQNIIHFKRGKSRKSLVLERDNPKGLLNFN